MVFHAVDALRLHIVAWFLLVAVGVVLAFFVKEKQAEQEEEETEQIGKKKIKNIKNIKY